MGTFVPPYPGKCDVRFWGMVKNFGVRSGGVAAWIFVFDRAIGGCGFGDRSLSLWVVL